MPRPGKPLSNASARMRLRLLAPSTPKNCARTATFSFRGNRYRVPAYLRGQTVDLHYDPFDLTQIEVWFNDAFLQLAEPDRIVTTTHPDVDPDPAPAPPPDSGLDYLALLRAERERLLQEQLDSIHFSQLDSANSKEHDDQ
jgi:putative transposase